MAGAAAILGDITCDRIFVGKGATLPAATINAGHIVAAAGIEATKIQQQIRRRIEIEAATTVTTSKRGIHLQQGVGSLVRFRAYLADANAGAATITVDLLKNGVSVLDAPLSFDSGDADYAILEGVFDTPIAALAADDRFEVDIVATAGGGTVGKGLVCELIVNDVAAA